MNQKLFDQRIQLANAYASANEVHREAGEKCAETKGAIVVFDAKHPEIMVEVKAVAHVAKQAAAAEKRKAAEAEAEGGEA